jgi:gas vesicle protein
MSDRDEFGAFLVGLVVGGVTGAVVALLFAPQSGEETRTLIKDKAIELRDKAGDTYEATREKAEEVANEAVKRAEALLKEAKSTAAELQEKGRVLLEREKKPADVKPKATKA